VWSDATRPRVPRELIDTVIALALPTVRELVVQAADWLADKGVPSARLDADRMLAHALGLRRLDLYLDLDRPLEPDEVTRFRELVRRRGRREPLAYVLGSWSFRGLELATDARALVPRPETEWLVERALARLPEVETPRVLDVGTGSGAIAISIAVELPEAVVTAVELSPDALALARENAATHDVEITFLESDLLAAVADSTFDLVLANLPYVGEGQGVDAEVERFEPALAVFAADDGRALIERLLTSVGRVLAPGGIVALELSDTQSTWAVARLAELGFEAASAERDLAGVERLAFARQPA
jgi:release factor glutamine methyltransferase